MFQYKDPKILMFWEKLLKGTLYFPCKKRDLVCVCYPCIVYILIRRISMVKISVYTNVHVYVQRFKAKYFSRLYTKIFSPDAHKQNLSVLLSHPRDVR